MNLKLWIRRVILLLIGLTIAHLGVTLFLLAELGSDPFNVMIQGLYRSLPWPDFMTHGYVHMVVSFGIILALLVVDRSYIRIGTLLCMFLGGPIIDAFTAALGSIINARSPMVLRLAALVAGCVILALGMSVVINSNAGTGPNDLVAIILSDKIAKVEFRWVRVGCDLFFVVLGWILKGTVGIGTVVAVFLTGPLVQFWLPKTKRIVQGILREE